MTRNALFRQALFLIPLLFLLSLLWPKGPSSHLEGRAGKIVDGDTFTLETGTQSIKIRLAEIDTPEMNQPYGTEAQQLLSQLIAGQAMRVKHEGLDRYQRTLGRVYVKQPWRLTDKDVNAELVRQGAAWVYRQYNRDASLLTLEAQAKAEKRGLWGLAEPIAPWDWRKGQKGQKVEVRREAESLSGCNPDKRTCKDMSSCDEAKFYLQHCGKTRLDGDKDGIPCEKLCR